MPNRRIADETGERCFLNVVFSLIAASLLFVALASVAAAEAAQVYEDFAEKPRWDAKNNRPDPNDYGTTTQDFGHSWTRHAGGEPGEVGGTIARSYRPAYYARPIAGKTLEDYLHASGTFSVTHSDGGSGVLIGWFNRASRGWRTPNSLVFRVDGESGQFRVLFEYGTRTWKTGGGATFEGIYQTTKTPMFLADGSPHDWTLEYDPAGAAGNGEMRFALDGNTYTAALASGHKQEGATFNRFGMLNQQVSGSSLTVYLDDLTIDGETVGLDLTGEARENNAVFDRFGILSLQSGGHFAEVFLDDISYTAERRSGGLERKTR